MEFSEAVDYLKQYNGKDIRIMEICGSHTAAIHKAGIPSLLSERIHLLSGPGCPVCVTPSAYVDKLIELALAEGCVIVTFGDLIRVPGSKQSLAEAKGQGADVRMVYSPMDILTLAKEEPEKKFLFAAIGFETTTPVYAMLVSEILEEKISNIRLLTALKTMPAVIDALMQKGAAVDAFLAPGHVSVVTGYDIFRPLAEKYHMEFVVAGFKPKELIAAFCEIVRGIGTDQVKNFYPSVVTKEGNTKAQEMVNRYFETCDAYWRGLGMVPGSGLRLKDEFAFLDAGSRELDRDQKANPACRCDRVLTGKLTPRQCPLFGKSCSPLHPQGACMVSEEGSCNTWFRYHVQEVK